MKRERINFKKDLYIHKLYKGEPKTLDEWTYILNCNWTTLRNRVNEGVLVKI